MPIIRSAKKKLRQDKKRTSVNLIVKKKVKAAIKAYKSHPSESLLHKSFSSIDLACKKNVFHKNKSNRLKSRLQKLLTKKTTKKETK